eukprot:15461088-Alexandrium_andersonii.AAC.1
MGPARECGDVNPAGAVASPASASSAAFPMSSAALRPAAVAAAASPSPSAAPCASDAELDGLSGVDGGMDEDWLDHVA